MSWPAHIIQITPEHGTVKPKSSVLLCLSPVTNLKKKGVQMPWRGSVYINCDGIQKVPFTEFKITSLLVTALALKLALNYF